MVDLTAIVGVGVTALLVIFGPPGTDVAAHEYYLFLFRHHLSLWNPMWYGGQVVFAGYAILPYILAAHTSLVSVNVVSVLTTIAALRWVGRREVSSPMRVGIAVATITWPTTLLSGDTAYLSGVALMSWALIASHAKMRKTYVILVILAGLCSVLAVGFGGLVLMSQALSAPYLDASKKGGVRLWHSVLRRLFSLELVVIYLVGAMELVVARGLVIRGRYPFFSSDLVQIVVVSVCVLVVSALGSKSGTSRALVVGSAVYLLACFVSFPIPSAVGSNIARLSEFGAPISAVMIASVWGGSKARGNWREILRYLAATLGAIAGLVWNFGSVSGPLLDSGAKSQNHGSYWASTLSYLAHNLGAGQRVEVVDTSSHAASYYLARKGVPLMRGWYRQDDFPNLSVLYSDHLTMASYLELLHRWSVEYVVLPPAPYDFSADSEAALVRSSKGGLEKVWHDSPITIYKVPQVTPLISRAVVRRQGFASITAVFPSRGDYRVRVSYSPYLHPSIGCISPYGHDQAIWRVPRGGLGALTFRFEFSTFFADEIAEVKRNCA